MSRSTLNFILDLVSFLNLLGLTITGFIMKYVLPPGTSGMGRALHGGTGRGIQVKELWLMTRHEWGSIHFYLAVVFVVLMITHVILHWRWIKSYAKSVASR
ncbi:MAG: hypothetical protein DRP65_09140 [Planctomycetota bacterium]|nr:MAG: hypothetical protein DRP65_09140 [Planctomycetota bacterium]